MEERQLDSNMDIYDDLLEMSRDEQSRSHSQNAKHDKEEMVALKRTVTSLQQRLQEMSSLKAVVATLQQKVAELEPLKAKVTTLQTKVTELEGTVEKMKKAKTTSEHRKTDSSRSRASSRDSHHSSASSKEKAPVRNHRRSHERDEQTKNKRVNCDQKSVPEGKAASQNKDSVSDRQTCDKEVRVKHKPTTTERSHKEKIAEVNRHQEIVAFQKEKNPSRNVVHERDQKEGKPHGNSNTEKDMKARKNPHDGRTDVGISEKLSKQLSSGNKGKGSDSNENKSVEKVKSSENRGIREQRQNISKQYMTDKKSEVSRKRKLSGKSESSSKKSKSDTRNELESEESMTKRITVTEKRKPDGSLGSDVKSFPDNKRQKVTSGIHSTEKHNSPMVDDSKAVCSKVHLDHNKATERKSDIKKSSNCTHNRKSTSANANVQDGINAKSNLKSNNSNVSFNTKKSLNNQQERSTETKEKTSINITKSKQKLPAHSISHRGRNVTMKENSIRPHSSTPKSKRSISRMDHAPVPPQSPVTKTGQDTESTKDWSAQRNLFGEKRLSENTTNVKPSNLNANASNDVCSCTDDSLSSQDTSKLIREIFGSSMVEESSENKPDTNVREKLYGKPGDTVANKVPVKTLSSCVQKLPVHNPVGSTKTEVSLMSSAKSAGQVASCTKLTTERHPVTVKENFDHKSVSLNVGNESESHKFRIEKAQHISSGSVTHPPSDFCQINVIKDTRGADDVLTDSKKETKKKRKSHVEPDGENTKGDCPLEEQKIKTRIPNAIQFENPQQENSASLRGEKLELTRSDHPFTERVKVKHVQDKTSDMLSVARYNGQPSGTKTGKEKQSQMKASNVKVPSDIPSDQSCSTECTKDLIDRSVRDESKHTLPSIPVEKISSLETLQSGESSQSDDVVEEYEIEEEIVESMARAQEIKIQRVSDSQDEEIDVMGEWSNGDEASNQSLAQQVTTSAPPNNVCTSDSTRSEVDVNRCDSTDITSIETTVMPQQNLKAFVESTCTDSSDGCSDLSDESASRDSFTNGPVKGLITETVSTTTSYGCNYLRMGGFSVMDSSKQRFDTGDAVTVVTSTSDITRQPYLDGRESCQGASVEPHVSDSDVRKADKPVTDKTSYCVSIGDIEHSPPAPIAGNQRLNQSEKHTNIKSKDPQGLSCRAQTDAEINCDRSRDSDVLVDVSGTSHKGTHTIPFHAKDKHMDADLFDEAIMVSHSKVVSDKMGAVNNTDSKNNLDMKHNVDCGQNVGAKPAEAIVNRSIHSESHSENSSVKSADIDKMLLSSDVETKDTRPCDNANVSTDASALPKALSGLLGNVTAPKELQPGPLNIDALLENKNLISAVKNALTMSEGQSNTNMTADVTSDLAQYCKVPNAERTQVVETSSSNVLETLQHQALKYRQDQNTTNFSNANPNNLLLRLQALASSTVLPGSSSRGSSQNKRQTILQHQGFGYSNTNAPPEKENVGSFRNSKDGTPNTQFDKTSHISMKNAVVSDNGISGSAGETVEKKKRVFGSTWGGKEQVDKNPQKWLLVANYIPPRSSNRQRWTDLQRLQAFQKVSPVAVDRQIRR